MMRRVLSWVLIVAAGLLAAPGGLLAFSREDGLWVARADGSAPKYLYSGSEADLTPDGGRIVFVTDDAVQHQVYRRLAVATLPDGRVTVFKDLPSHNCLSPAWSPDGTRIVFEHYPPEGGSWKLGVVDADGSHYREIPRPNTDTDYYCPRWAPSGDSLYVHDFEEILQVDPAGSVVSRVNVKQRIPGWWLDSASRMDVAPDGQAILLELRHGQDPHVTAGIWWIDLTSNRVSRQVEGTGPHWIGPDSFLYTGLQGRVQSIFRRKLDGHGRALVLKDAEVCSATR